MIGIGNGCGNAFGIIASPGNANTSGKQTLSGLGQQSYSLPQVIREALMTNADRLIDLAPQSVTPRSVSQSSFRDLPENVQAHFAKAMQVA